VFYYENFFSSLSGVQLTAPVQMITFKESEVLYIVDWDAKHYSLTHSLIHSQTDNGDRLV